MEVSTIIYFCDCYLIMLDYEEELIDIIYDFKEKEIDEKVLMLKNECNEIINMNAKERIEEINRIITGCVDLDIEVSELQEIIKYIHQNL
ncbi:hypothetical protein [Clostridium sporogenes]|uniref:hypothetical protein n=1 Tax=Clostridium sporogenes TaxID=1509 RepID=UPI00223897A7|nr:hypothetical protein [Clostridium sporogenes]MCW6111079.1 hypothetical protein [Clostridium sporogenes]